MTMSLFRRKCIFACKTFITLAYSSAINVNLELVNLIANRLTYIVMSIIRALVL